MQPIEPTMSVSRQLLILGCSDRKLQDAGGIPAIQRYDGPTYRILRSYLRTNRWPTTLSVGVFSAKYGLIGGLTPIEQYNQRMDTTRASELLEDSTLTLANWTKSHSSVRLILGKNYLQAVNLDIIRNSIDEVVIADGVIGKKLQHLSQFLRGIPGLPKVQKTGKPEGRPLYFLPDWDDMLDADYDFATDEFSAKSRAGRTEVHCIKAMEPKHICDGVLVSLAQHFGSKGVLKRFHPTDIESLAPASIRDRCGLGPHQTAFGDCGAFSYVDQPTPTVSTTQALTLYESYGFDFGASVDHIPVQDIRVSGARRKLSDRERRSRVHLTVRNAEEFLDGHRKLKCSFIPVGVIQGISPRSYGRCLHDYMEMGYTHVGIGGLVPRGDSEIIAIARELLTAQQSSRKEAWTHFFGVFRPNIQEELKRLGMSSFDSATYFRKAWLRSDQNYMAANGKWYAAVRVPVANDPRTAKRLIESGQSPEELQVLEARALTSLHAYGRYALPLKDTLDAVMQYDSQLDRGETAADLESAYSRTLRERPWEHCSCPVCTALGIDVLIFRGYNRNKRRGAHNTFMLYSSLRPTRTAHTDAHNS